MGKWEDIVQQKSLRAKPFQAKPDWDRMEAMLDQEDKGLAAGFWTDTRKWAAGFTFIGLLLLSMWLIADYMTPSGAATSLAIVDTMIAEPLLAHCPDDPDAYDKAPAESAIDHESSTVLEQRPYSTPIASSSSPTSSNTDPVAKRETTQETEPSVSESSQTVGIDYSDKRESRTNVSPILSSLSTEFALNGDVSSKPPVLNSVMLLPEKNKEATFFQKTSQRVQLALGPGVDKKWPKASWATKIYLTGTAFRPTLWIDSTIQQPNIVMAGLGIELSRQLTPRWEVGGRLDIGSYNQIMQTDPSRYSLPVSPSGQSYLAIQGRIIDYSGQAKYHFAKQMTARFRPYVLAGLGLHFVQSNLYGVDNLATDYLSNVSSYRAYEASTTAAPGYFSNYQTSLVALKSQEDTESSYVQIGQRHTFSRVMLYSGLGFDLRLHRRVSLTWEMTLHANRSTDPFFRSLADFSFQETTGNSDPLATADQVVVPPQVQENWTPGFMRHSIGLRIAL